VTVHRALQSLFIGLAIALLVAAPVSAEVYKYRDARGNILLTDRPVSGMTLLKRYGFRTGRTVTPPGGALVAMQHRRDALAPLIERVANEQRLRPALIHAVIRAESAYQADAVSSKGAVGLMQLMPATAERFGVTDRRDPEQNLRGGTIYLRQLIDLFDRDLRLALAAYNAGENAVIRHGRQIPPYPETQNYVRKVLRFLQAEDGDDRLALN
jgi:soluble lytic murein transglycosylase-like protein